MKRIIASAGLVALGAANLQAAYAPGLSSTETTKPWSISATLRGFYDDNYNTAPAGPNKLDSYGFSINPRVGLNLPLDQTLVRLSYSYNLMYYEARPKNKYDQSHVFDAVLSHAFSERYSLDLTDSFALAQEPQLLEPAGGTLVRTEGNNIRNRAAINFNAQLTRLFGILVGYSNTFVDYAQDASDVRPQPPTVASRSALLDRVEHLANIDLRWQALPQTVGVLGYQFGLVDYTSSEFVDPPANTNPADSRNSRSHYVYVGADHSFRPDLTASIRAGGQFIDFYNDSSRGSIVTPYATANLKYNYAAGSFLEVGARHSRNATDVSVLDQETTSVYAQLAHRITPSLTGSLLGQFQYSTFNGSTINNQAADDKAEKIFLVGLNLAYRFSQYFSAEVGYNYDRLVSDLSSRGFSRNRAYVGVTASY